MLLLNPQTFISACRKSSEHEFCKQTLTAHKTKPAASLKEATGF